VGLVTIADLVRPGVRRDMWSPRRRIAVMATVVVLLHAGGFVLLLLWTGHRPGASGTSIGVGTGLLAYSLGLRHAFDIDHIAAIDNTTRSLMGRGERPVATGFFFSLGHSSVVFVMSCLLCLGLRALYGQVSDDGSALHRWTNLIGTSVSGVFLLLIGVINAAVLVGLVRVFRDLRRGRYDEVAVEEQLARRGVLNRVLRRFSRSIDASWKLYPLGVLFGLGFDTATEISLLVLAGTTVGVGLPFWAILSLPLLFAAGMSLLDTIDGILMSRAYGWAFVRPVRKVYYNLMITGLSVAVALFIGALQVVQVFRDEFGLRGGLFDVADRLDLEFAGYAVVVSFVVVWAGAAGIWRLGRIEERWATAEDLDPVVRPRRPPTDRPGCPRCR
jgi:high-affinity nickel-transport protein